MSKWIRIVSLAAVALATTVLLVRLAHHTIGPDRYGADFLCYWTAAELMGAGENPYDPARQIEIQTQLGWDKETKGHGIYEFLPFYHAPWVALLLVPLLPLGLGLAKLTWIVVAAESLILSGWLLGTLVRGLPLLLTVAVVALSGYSIKVVALGQHVPMMLLLVVLAWKALDEGHDLLAGALLAASAMKPHLVALTIAAVSLWALRRGRWRVPAGVACGGILLSGACLVAAPSWASGMIGSLGATPLPTAYFPGLGVSWRVLVGVVLPDGPAALAAWGVVVVVVLAALGRVGWDRRSSLSDVFGGSMIATFLVLPYVRYYDLPMLMVAIVPLLGERIGPPRAGLLALVLLTLPSIQLVYLAATQVPPVRGVLRPEFTLSWVPFLVAALWVARGRRAAIEPLSGS